MPTDKTGSRFHRAPDLRDYRAVIFDVDGTLIDSMYVWEEINREYLAGFGVDCPEGLAREMENITFRAAADYFIDRFHIPDPPDKIIADWVEMARIRYAERLSLKPGAAEILFWLKNTKIPAAIASANNRRLIDSMLEARGFADAVSAVVSCDDVGVNKPAPDVYLEAARRLGVEPRDCLVFEDVLPGIRSGLSAGMTVCAVEDRYSAPTREEKAALAHYYITDFRECQPLKVL